MIFKHFELSLRGFEAIQTVTNDFVSSSSVRKDPLREFITFIINAYKRFVVLYPNSVKIWKMTEIIGKLVMRFRCLLFALT